MTHLIIKKCYLYLENGPYEFWLHRSILNNCNYLSFEVAMLHLTDLGRITPSFLSSRGYTTDEYPLINNAQILAKIPEKWL